MRATDIRDKRPAGLQFQQVGYCPPRLFRITTSCRSFSGRTSATYLAIAALCSCSFSHWSTILFCKRKSKWVGRGLSLSMCRVDARPPDREAGEAKAAALCVSSEDRTGASFVFLSDFLDWASRSRRRGEGAARPESSPSARRPPRPAGALGGPPGCRRPPRSGTGRTRAASRCSRTSSAPPGRAPGRRRRRRLSGSPVAAPEPWRWRREEQEEEAAERGTCRPGGRAGRGPPFLRAARANPPAPRIGGLCDKRASANLPA